MPDLLDFGMDWLANQLQEHVSRTVVYRRAVNQVPVPATIGRTLMKLADGDGGVRMEWTDRDFLIRADVLVIAGNRITPERGDTVVDAGQVYEVMAPGGEPPWRPSDPFGHLLRIHTKRIGAV